MSSWKNANPEAKKKGRESRNKAQNRRRDERIAKGIETLGGFCAGCGCFDPGQLQFHHKDPSKKEFHSSSFGNCSQERVDAEIAKCGLLCKDCHTILHANGPEALGLDDGWLIEPDGCVDPDEWDELF